MRYEDAAIPAGMAWSSPFVKWQGSLAEVSSLDLAADVTSRALTARQIEPGQIDGLVLGWTVPQPDIFYGAPTLAARLGAGTLSGPMISQACATSVACLAAAAGAVTAGGLQLVVTTDRTSNGPQVLYPAPSAMGGAPVSTHWYWTASPATPGPGRRCWQREKQWPQSRGLPARARRADRAAIRPVRQGPRRRSRLPAPVHGRGADPPAPQAAPGH